MNQYEAVLEQRREIERLRAENADLKVSNGTLDQSNMELAAALRKTEFQLLTEIERLRAIIANVALAIGCSEPGV